MNLHQMYAEQYRLSQQQYKEALERVEKHYEQEMKAEAESFERLKQEYESRMDRLTAFKAEQAAALKVQYAVDDEVKTKDY